MKKHAIISLILIAIIIVVPIVVHAAVFVSTKRSFGGKVTSTSVTSVTCSGTGTGPITLSKMSGLQYYAEVASKSPQSGDWILGLYNTIPNFSTCYTTVGQYRIPYPVSTTSTYGISGGSVLSSFGF